MIVVLGMIHCLLLGWAVWLLSRRPPERTSGSVAAHSHGASRPRRIHVLKNGQHWAWVEPGSHDHQDAQRGEHGLRIEGE